VDDKAEIDRLQRIAMRTGFRLGNQQQRVERRDQAVGLANRAFKRLHRLVMRRVAEEGPFKLVAQAIEWCTQVMGDVVGHLAHAHHEPLDLFEHLVEVLRQVIEFVTAALHGNAPRQVTRHDLAAGSVDGLKAPEHVSADPDTTDDAEDQRDRERGEQRAAHRRLDGIELTDVAPDQQSKTTTQRKLHGATRADLLVIDGPALVVEIDPAWCRLESIRGPFGQIARQRRVTDRQQVEAALPDTRGALKDDASQAKKPAPLVLLVEAGDFGTDGFIRLRRHESGRAPVDEPQQQHDRHAEQHQVGEGEPEGRRSEDFKKPHEANIRHLLRCAKEARHNLCRSWSADERYGRR